MKRKLKRRLLKLIKQQLLDEALPELYLSSKVQHAFDGLRNELASHNKRITTLEALNYGYGTRSYIGNVTPFKRKPKKQHDEEVDESA